MIYTNKPETSAPGMRVVEVYYRQHGHVYSRELYLAWLPEWLGANPGVIITDIIPR